MLYDICYSYTISVNDKPPLVLPFCRRVTKARQWKRPVWETTAAVPIESAAATSEGVEDEDGLVSYVLPPGWKELVDKKTGRPYYVNR